VVSIIDPVGANKNALEYAPGIFQSRCGNQDFHGKSIGKLVIDPRKMVLYWDL